MTQTEHQPEASLGDHVYLTSRQASVRLGICSRTLLRAVQRGAIAPARRTPGGHARFRVADVEAYGRHLAASPAVSASRTGTVP